MFGSYGRHVSATNTSVNAKRKTRLHTFEHTHLGVYVVGIFTVVCIFVDSSQVIHTAIPTTSQRLTALCDLVFRALWKSMMLARNGSISMVCCPVFDWKNMTVDDVDCRDSLRLCLPLCSTTDPSRIRISSRVRQRCVLFIVDVIWCPVVVI